ncbi:SH3 domain-containing protein [Bacteroides fragilis]
MTAFAAIAPGLYRVNVNSTLNVRNAPGGAKIGSLSNGDLVQVTACEDDWAQVSLNDGRTGYVHEQYLEPFSTLAAPAGTSYSTVGLSELRHYTPFAILLLPSLPSSDYVQIPDRCSTQVAFYGAGLNCSCSELGVTAHSSGSATLRM